MIKLILRWIVLVSFFILNNTQVQGENSRRINSIEIRRINGSNNANLFFIKESLQLQEFRGGFQDEYDEFTYDREYDSYDIESEEDLYQAPHRHPGNRKMRNQRRNFNSPQRKKKNFLDGTTSGINSAIGIAKKTADMATSATVTSIKGSTRAAVHLASPKHVSRRDIVGVWRFDQQVSESDSGTDDMTACAANIEFNLRGEVITRYNEKDMISTYLFTEKKWPFYCRVEFKARAFQGPYDKEPIELLYKGTYRRKIANTNIIKLEGKIYKIIGGNKLWSKKKQILVGSFVARKNTFEEESDDDFYDDEDEDYYDDEYL